MRNRAEIWTLRPCIWFFDSHSRCPIPFKSYDFTFSNVSSQILQRAYRLGHRAVKCRAWDFLSVVVLNAWFPHFDGGSSATLDTLILSFFQLTVKWPLHQKGPFVVLEKGTESENPILPGRTTKESVELSYYENHCEEEPQWKHRSEVLLCSTESQGSLVDPRSLELWPRKYIFGLCP